MNKFENIKSGSCFSVLGVTYQMVRDTGEVVDQPNRNQWGRREGGTHKARKVAVRVWQRHRGWSYVQYVAFADYYSPVKVPNPSM